MNADLAYERSLYFRDWKHYLVSMLTHEDNYLIWKYLYFLRREEGAGWKPLALYWRRRKNNLGSRLGLQIYAGCCGRGLKIWHYGSVIISGEARLGENCIFHGQACIGNDGHSQAAPVIGSNVDFGVGCRVLGDISIADNVRIGANAVVTRSCPETGAVLVGIPARVL